ncbi:hypothetical protein HDU96_006103 [Phlyctochytrium bullatum]|nr:hypothetical protein HDU96_006103 [Phlyctochytrium bullatum]
MHTTIQHVLPEVKKVAKAAVAGLIEFLEWLLATLRKSGFAPAPKTTPVQTTVVVSQESTVFSITDGTEDIWSVNELAVMDEIRIQEVATDVLSENEALGSTIETTLATAINADIKSEGASSETKANLEQTLPTLSPGVFASPHEDGEKEPVQLKEAGVAPGSGSASDADYSGDPVAKMQPTGTSNVNVIHELKSASSVTDASITSSEVACEILEADSEQAMFEEDSKPFAECLADGKDFRVEISSNDPSTTCETIDDVTGSVSKSDRTLKESSAASEMFNEEGPVLPEILVSLGPEEDNNSCASYAANSRPARTTVDSPGIPPAEYASDELDHIPADEEGGSHGPSQESSSVLTSRNVDLAHVPPVADAIVLDQKSATSATAPSSAGQEKKKKNKKKTPAQLPKRGVATVSIPKKSERLTETEEVITEQPSRPSLDDSSSDKAQRDKWSKPAVAKRDRKKLKTKKVVKPTQQNGPGPAQLG